MKHLVMFDIDGTLTRTTEEDARCYTQAMEEHLGHAMGTTWDDYEHVTDTGIAEEVFRRHARDPAGIADVRTRFLRLLEDTIARMPDACLPVPGAVAFLDALRARDDVTLGIATGGWGPSARHKLAHAGFAIDGIAFASADDAAARVDIMEACRARAGGVFERITYLGDGTWDVRATQALGWDFIGIGGEGQGERLRALGAERVFDDFRDAAAIRAGLGLLEG